MHINAMTSKGASFPLEDKKAFSFMAEDGWTMVTRRTLLSLGVVTAGLVAGGIVTARSYAQAMQAARKAIDPALSTIIDTSFGSLEYAESGAGTPLMMIHGTGGGFDQGLKFAKPLLAKGYRIIAPSRFGYLRSDFPEKPSSANQADAFAQLLDNLGIDRIAIAGGSAGALSAIEFAIRHPDRCAALIPIVPATFTPSDDAVTADNAPTGVEAAMFMLRSDFLFWAALSALPDMMTGTLLATDPALIVTVSAAEAQRARDMLWSILPVSERAEGLLNDARLAGHATPAELEKIQAPVLAISVEDDRFGTAKAARHIAQSLPDAQLEIYGTGGHIWLGHNDELFDRIDRFLRETGYA